MRLGPNKLKLSLLTGGCLLRIVSQSLQIWVDVKKKGRRGAVVSVDTPIDVPVCSDYIRLSAAIFMSVK